MALSEAEFDRIEAFLDGSLSADESRQMQEAMAQDSRLQQAVDEHRVIWESLQVPVAVEYFQEMHSQLEERGLLEFDDIWVEAHLPDDASSDHSVHTHHHANHDEPEVFVTDDPKADTHDTTHPIDVAVDEHPDVQPPYPEHDMRHDEWENPGHIEPPHSHFDGSDEF